MFFLRSYSQAVNDLLCENTNKVESPERTDASPSNLLRELDDITVNEDCEQVISDSGDDYQSDAPPSNSETESDSLYR